MLAGRLDAWSLLGLTAGIASTSPLLYQNPVDPMLWALAGAGAAGLTFPRLRKRLNPHDLRSRENFVLPSSAPYVTGLDRDSLNIGYTTDYGRAVGIPYDRLPYHSAVVGQSGTGKTTLAEWILFQHMCNGGGWLFIDAKIDYDTLHRLSYLATVTGRPHDFYVLNISDPAISHTYSPVQNGDADEIASRLLNLVPASPDSPGADYYRQATNHALTVIVGALKAAGYTFTFGDLSILLQSDVAMTQLLRKLPDNPEKRSLLIFLDKYRVKGKDGAPIDTKKMKDELGGMSGRISTFANGNFGKIFNVYEPEINLTDIILGRKFLYVMLPTMGKDEAARNFAKMLLSDFRSAIANVQALPKRQRPGIPFLSLLDEFGAYAMKGVDLALQQARSANIAMMPLFQSFSQLNEVTPEFADAIIQNTWSRVYFKFGAKDSSEMAAEIIGKTKRFTRSFTASANASTGTSSLRTTPLANEGDGGGLSSAYAEEEEFVVTPDQLKAMPVGQAVLTVGPRVYHLRTPLLKYPSPLPSFAPVRHATSIPPETRPLNFETNFRKFVSTDESAQVGPDYKTKKSDGGAEQK